MNFRTNKNSILAVLLAGCFHFILLAGLARPLRGQLQPEDLLLVVNQDSPTSVYVAKMYRQYYPSITDEQVVVLSGLSDACISPVNEIITRETFNQMIAAPIRQHLISNNRVNSTRAIVTTAGIPYRIEDTDYSDIIRPAGSTVYPSGSISYVNAASVESELAVLFQIDSDSPNPAPLKNRLVNPYQAYRGSSINSFGRDILDNRGNMTWFCPLVSGISYKAAVVEGAYNGYGVEDRNFSAGDIYLTCRLDGPKIQGQNNAIFAIRNMLERSRRASSDQVGINPAEAVVVFDEVPTIDIDYNRIFNLESGATYNEYQPNWPQAPNITFPEIHHDHSVGYYQMTGHYPEEGIFGTGIMSAMHHMTMIYDDRAQKRSSQSDLAMGQAAVVLNGYGCNGDENSSPDYLIAGGPEGAALFKLSYGAVFNSIESFNAVTFFADVSSSQAKIVDFISIGGSGAIGHAFEPVSDAIVDNEFLVYNLLADNNGDGYADLTFAEAAFTALPYLSWSEVVIGDPLMRIAYSAGGIARIERLEGDVNFDGTVTNYDLYLVSRIFGSKFGDGNYDDGADINQDGSITTYDMWLVSENIGTAD